MIASHDAELLKIQFETEINAPPDKVWAVLASPEGMHEWFSKRLVFEPRLGGQFRLDVSEPGGAEFTFTGEVVTFDPGRELAFTWIEHEHGKEPWTVSTLVSFRLEPTARGTTLVRLSHTGFEKLQGGLARTEYEGHIVGWERSETLKDLKVAVESAG